MSVTPRKIIIPCAGLGTRLFPLSATVPKELLPIGKWPAVFHTILEAFDAGLQEIVMVTSAAKKDFFRQAFAPKTPLINALRKIKKEELIPDLAQIGIQDRMVLVEQHPLAGLGHAVLSARRVIGDEPFCVALPDEHLISLPGQPNEWTALLAAHRLHQKSAISLLEIPRKETGNYGIAQLGSPVPGDPPLIPIQGCVEKPAPSSAPSSLALIGRYVFSPTLWALLEKTAPGQGGEIQLTDAIHVLAQKEGLWGHVFQGKRFDIGNFSGYYACVSHYLSHS